MADARLQLIIDAKNQATPELKQLSGSLAGVQGAARKSSLSITDLASAVSLAERGFRIAQDVIDETAGATLRYANQVRSLTTAIGATPEEASKLIQVADDMGVEFGQLETALKGAIRKGVEPTIAGIARLSDEYLKLAPGVERTKFLMDNFGRSGADIARLMELGSGKIDAMGQSIEGTARLMDQDALDAAENYRVALDELNDSVEDLKIGVGNGLIPKLTALANLLSSPLFEKRTGDLGKDFRAGADASAEFINAFFGLNAAEQEHARLVAEATAAENAQAAALQGVSTAAGATQETIDAMNERMRASGREGGLLSGAMDNAAAATWEFKEATRRAADEADAAASSIGAMIDEANRGISSDIKNFLDDMKWMAAGGGEIQRAFENVKRGIESGAINEQEGEQMLKGLYAAAEELSADIGLIDYSEAGQNIRDTLGAEVGNVWEVIKNIKGEGSYFKITVETEYVTTGTPPPGVTPPSGTGPRRTYVNRNRDVQNPGGGGGSSAIPAAPTLSGESAYPLVTGMGDLPAGEQAAGGSVYIEQNFNSAGAAATGLALTRNLVYQRLNASMGV